MRGVPNTDAVVQLKNGGTRRYRTIEERRQIVEQTMKPGASVSVVARAHDVNANQVFKWRRQYQQGELTAAACTTLVPVKVSDTISQLAREPKRRARARQSGIIDIDLGHARIRIEGSADPDCVRAALAGLIR